MTEYSSILHGPPKMILVKLRVTRGKLMVAKGFVRCLLRKDAALRPTAAEALSHAFMSSSEEELKLLYDEMVMIPWTAKVTADKNVEYERVPGAMKVVTKNESQDALVEVVENIGETRERKRQYTEGKENDGGDEGDVGRLLKKRKLYE